MQFQQVVCCACETIVCGSRAVPQICTVRGQNLGLPQKKIVTPNRYTAYVEVCFFSPKWPKKTFFCRSPYFTSSIGDAVIFSPPALLLYLKRWHVLLAPS